MGFLSGLTKTSNSSQLKPWGPAAGPMQDYMNQLQGMPQMQAFGGNYAADMNPMYANALNTGSAWGQNLMSQGQGLYDKGMGSYQDFLETQRVTGPRQFSYDQGLFNQTMNNFMPGLQGMVGAQGRMSSMGLQSNLGQLVSQAGAMGGGMSSNPMSKLGQGSAALTAQNTLNNQMFASDLYSKAAGMANQNAYGAGMANLNTANAYDQNMGNSYMGLAKMGLGMQGTGLDAMNYAGSNMQKYDQFARDMERQQFMDKQTIPMQDLMSRLNAFSGLASTFGKNKQTQQGSALQGLQGLAGLAQTGMGLYSGFGNLFGTPSGSTGFGQSFGGGTPLGGGFNANLGNLAGTTYGQQYAVPPLSYYGI